MTGRETRMYATDVALQGVRRGRQGAAQLAEYLKTETRPRVVKREINDAARLWELANPFTVMGDLERLSSRTRELQKATISFDVAKREAQALGIWRRFCEEHGWLVTLTGARLFKHTTGAQEPNG